MLLFCTVALAVEPTRVSIEVLATVQEPILAEATWLGEEKSVALAAPSGPTLPGGGRVLRGTLEGDSVRLLPLRVYRGTPEKKTLLWEGLEPLVEGDNTVSFEVNRAQSARRVSVAASSMERDNQFAAGRAAGIGWLVATGMYVAWLARSFRR